MYFIASNHRNLRWRLSIVFIILVTGALCFSQPTPQQPNIVLANDIVCFEFNQPYIGLVTMKDLATGANHVQVTGEKAALWEIVFDSAAERQTLSSTQTPCTSAKVEKLPDGSQRATFEWADLDLESKKGIVSVRVTVELPKNIGIASWRIWVENNSETWGLYEVQFPKCSGFLKSGEYDIAIPTKNSGELFKNCGEKMMYYYPYGWSMPMQFMCATKGTDSVYIATHDPNAWDKVFTIEPGKELNIKTNVENMGVPGSDHKSPFPVMMGVYRGSWLEGCKIYREFALTTPWTSEGKLSQRTSTPQMLKNIGLWMLVGNYIGPECGTLGEKNKPLVDAQKYFDVPVAAHWYNWHQIPFDTHYPHYFPPKPGIPDQVRDLVAKGLLIMPYINGRIIDISNTDFNDYFPYCAKDYTGKHYTETYGNQVKQAPMCPYTQFWQDKVAQIVERLAEEVAVNAVYIDQIAAAGPVLCFDKSHGHPLGGGGWWVDGYRMMLKKVQKVAHSKGRDMTITTECAAEPFMDGVDAFLTWIKPDERSIPMIPAVYSGYSLYFGSPAWFEHGDRAWIMAQGRAFLWGCQNGWMGFELFNPEHSKKADYLKRVGKYRIATRKFLTFGELVDIIKPTNNVESITERWPDHGNNPRNATLPSIQGSIWKAEDGMLAVFLANYLEKENTVEFIIEPSRYGVKGASTGFAVTRISPEGNRSEGTVPQKTIKRIETLEGWEIRVLEIKEDSGSQKASTPYCVSTVEEK